MGIKSYIKLFIEGVKAGQRLQYALMFPISNHKDMPIYKNNDVVLIGCGLTSKQPGIMLACFNDGTEGIVINEAFHALPEHVQLAGFEHEMGHSVLKHDKTLSLLQRILKSKVYMKQEYEADAYASQQAGKAATLELLHVLKGNKGVSQKEMQSRIDAVLQGV